MIHIVKSIVFHVVNSLTTSRKCYPVHTWLYSQLLTHWVTLIWTVKRTLLVQIMACRPIGHRCICVLDQHWCNGNGRSLVRCRAIACIMPDLLSNEQLECNKIKIKIPTFSLNKCIWKYHPHWQHFADEIYNRVFLNDMHMIYFSFHWYLFMRITFNVILNIVASNGLVMTGDERSILLRDLCIDNVCYHFRMTSHKCRGVSKQWVLQACQANIN